MLLLSSACITNTFCVTQHDGHLCGLKAWLSSPDRPPIPEALKQRMEAKVLLASRQNLEKKVVYRGAPEWKI